MKDSKISWRQNFLKVIALLLIVALSVFVGTLIFSITDSLFLWDAIDLMSFWVILFILAIVLKIDNKNPLFIINMVLGSFIVSYFQFGQGYLIILMMVIIQKLFKLL